MSASSPKNPARPTPAKVSTGQTLLRRHPYLPSELLQMYRTRARLTQTELAQAIGLKSFRMVQYWEGSTSLPKAHNLKKLVELFITRQIFLTGQELEEARQLWEAVKQSYDNRPVDNFTPYPILDEAWLTDMLTKNSPGALVAGVQSPAPGLYSLSAREKLKEGKNELNLRGTSSFTPVRSYLPTEASHNLPSLTTSFVGRQLEIAEIEGLLSKKEVDSPRLVTITGPGGIGKTRLGLEVGRALVSGFKDGVWLVELAALAEAHLVGPAIAGVLGVSERNNQALLSNLSEYLSQKQLLLILDNCEHLLAEVAWVAETLLKSCPTLKIVATSREALNIAGEQRWSTASLSTPNDPKPGVSAQSVAGFEAVRLFCERASAVQPYFQLTDHNALAITQICQRLDGIPLALELAAARVESLGVEQIAARLDKRFLLLTAGPRTALPRQKTLRATLDWSYDLLSTTQKQLFARLAVFVGGWSLKAAEEICATPDLAAESVLDELAQLVNKSLVVVIKTNSAPFRYRMLETIREYSYQKLMELDSEAIKELRTNHLWYYLRLAEQVKPRYRTTYKASPDQLQSEFDNWQAALRWSLQAKELVEPGLRLGVALDYYWERNGYIYISEGQALLNQLQKSAREAGLAHRPDYAWLLVALAGLADMMGDFKERLLLLEESLALFRKLDDKFGIATVLNDLSNQAIFVGNFLAASRYLQESSAIFRELDNKIGLAATLGNATLNAYFQKDFEGASHYLAENLALNRQTGNKRGFALSFLVKGLVAYSLGQYEEANHILQEDLGLLDELGDKFAISLNLWAKGRIADKQARYSEAIAYFQESLNLAYKLGYMVSIAYILGGITVLLCKINDLAGGPGQFELAPNITSRDGYAWAARLGGAMTTLMAQLGMVMDPVLKEDFEAATEEIQTNSGKKAFEGWFEEGRFMPLEEVINSMLAIKLENNGSSEMKGALDTAE